MNDQIAKLKTNPVLHIEKIQGVETLEPYQKEICQAIVDHDRVAVAACHDVGKSFTMAKIVLWAGSVFAGAKIITTAPTFLQVEKLLWSEIRSGFTRSKFQLGGVMLNTSWKIDDDWFALGMSPKDDAQASRFQGFHGDMVIVIFDEATGIHESRWTQAEGLLTSANTKFIAIGNPTSRQSEFYRCFSSAAWHKIYLSCFDSPNLKVNGITDMAKLENELSLLQSLDEQSCRIKLRSYLAPQPKLLSASWVMGMALKLGIHHPLFQSKVLGRFPEDDDHALITLGSIETAQAREPRPGKSRTIGIDPARFGSDKTVITEMEGETVTKVWTLIKKSTSEITGFIVNRLSDLPRFTDETLVIDGTGIGAGVVDQLKERQNDRSIPDHITISEVHFGAAAPDKEHYFNLKAYLFVKLSEDIKSSLVIPSDASYLEQLPAIKYTFDSKGRYIIESKDDYKKRTGLGSPDEADSLALANYGRYPQNEIGQFTDKFLDSGTTMAGSLGSGDRW